MKAIPYYAPFFLVLLLAGYLTAAYTTYSSARIHQLSKDSLYLAHTDSTILLIVERGMYDISYDLKTGTVDPIYHRNEVLGTKPHLPDSKAGPSLFLQLMQNKLIGELVKEAIKSERLVVVRALVALGTSAYVLGDYLGKREPSIYHEKVKKHLQHPENWEPLVDEVFRGALESKRQLLQLNPRELRKGLAAANAMDSENPLAALLRKTFQEKRPLLEALVEKFSNLEEEHAPSFAELQLLLSTPG